MMRWLISTSLNFRLLVIPIGIALMVVGVAQVRQTPVDVLPEFTPPYVEVQTEALGLSAEEVEELITVPLERDLLNGVAGIDVLRSESVLGLSSVVLLFEPGTDLLNARQLVQERLLQAHVLPKVSKPPTMLQPLSSQSRVMMIGLSSEELSPIDLGLLARWTIRPRLMGVPGVANVVMWGQREHQIQVQVDPEHLQRNGVSLQQVISTAGNAQLVSPLSFLEASTPGTGGFIDTPNQRLQLRHILPIADPEGLAEVPVDGIPGGAKRLGDVADVVVDHQPLIGDAVIGDGDGLMLVVEKFPGTNTLEVTREVDAALDAMRPGLSGVRLDSTIFRPASFIEHAIDNLALALLIGFLLVAVVLAALFFDLRAALVAFVSIPLSVVAALLVLSLRGESMNALVLAGLLLAVLVVVDDGVVGVENIRRRLEERRRAGSTRSAAAVVLEASLEVRGPVGFATLIILVAVIPVFFLGGQLGDFFEPLALSYALAVLASTLVALTVTPALSLLLLGGRGTRGGETPVLRRAAARYGAALSRVVRQPGTVLAAAAVVGIAGIAMLPLFGQSLVPTFKERELLIHLKAATGTSRPEMVRIAGRVSRELRSLAGVENVGAHVGRAVMSDQKLGVSSGEVWVSIDSDVDYGTTVDRIRGVVDGYPGLDGELVTYSTDRIRTLGSVADGKAGDEDRRDNLAALRANDEPLVVRIYGNDLDELRSKADEVRGLMGGVDGVVNPRVEPQIAEATLEIEPNIAAASRHSMKPGDIRRAATTLVQGIPVGSLFEEQKVFEVIVVGAPEIRHSVSSVRRLLLDTPGGRQVRLADVADVRIVPSPGSIKREAASRYLDVGADISGRDLGAVIDDVERRLGELSFPLEYHAEVLSASSDREAAQGRLLMFAIAAAIAIVLLLQAAFGSWLLGLFFFAALPIALAGGVFAARLVGDEISLGMVAGLLAVFALTVRNGVLLVAHYRRLERESESAPTPSLTLRGARERLPSVATTALTTGAAFLPFLALGSIPGNEIAHPLAAVALGGLVTSTLFTLFVVPPLYLFFGGVERAAAEGGLADDLLRRVPAAAKEKVDPPVAIQPSRGS
ncbi:MAG: efflux RND transporter permease subunit [Actinomycetota bacterium]